MLGRWPADATAAFDLELSATTKAWIGHMGAE
jgi:hypothetical protein